MLTKWRCCFKGNNKLNFLEPPWWRKERHPGGPVSPVPSIKSCVNSQWEGEFPSLCHWLTISIKSTPPSLSWPPLLVQPRRRYSPSLPALSYVLLYFIPIVVDERAYAFFYLWGMPSKTAKLSNPGLCSTDASGPTLLSESGCLISTPDRSSGTSADSRIKAQLVRAGPLTSPAPWACLPSSFYSRRMMSPAEMLPC